MISQKIRNINLYHRIVAFFLLISFSLLNSSSNLSYAMPLEGNSPGAKSVDPKVILNSLKIPQELGALQEIYAPTPTSSSQKLVIYLEDAHTNFDSETHIQELIRFFREKYGLPLVLLEGGEGKLDRLFFKSFPDQELKEKVLADYLKKGELSGGETASILDKGHSTEYYGIESQSLYDQNKQAFLEAVGQEKAILDKLAHLESDLERKNVSLLSPRAKIFHQKTRAFHQETFGLIHYTKLLRTLYPYSQVKRPREFALSFPELNKILKVNKETPAAPNSELDIVTHQFIQNIEKDFLAKLPKEKQKEIGQTVQAYRTGDLDRGELLKRIEAIAEEVKYPLEIPGLLKPSSRITKTLSSIRGTKLLDELEALEEELINGLPKTKEEKKFLEDFRQLELLKRFAKLELTAGDWKKVQAYSVQRTADSNLPSAMFSSHIRFYELASQRDEILFQNINRRMDQAKARISLVVTGGFHSGGITQKLREAHTPFILIAPEIRQMGNPMNYLHVMRDEVSYSRYFKGSFWDALVKDYAVKLISSLKENDRMLSLKHWRDQIIQNAILEGKVTQASSYTQYVDALVQAIKKKSPENFSRNIEKEWDSLGPADLNQLRAVVQKKLEVFALGIKAMWQTDAINTQAVGQIFKQMDAIQVSQLAPAIHLIKDTRFGNLGENPGLFRSVRRETDERSGSEYGPSPSTSLGTVSDQSNRRSGRAEVRAAPQSLYLDYMNRLTDPSPEKTIEGKDWDWLARELTVNQLALIAVKLDGEVRNLSEPFQKAVRDRFQERLDKLGALIRFRRLPANQENKDLNGRSEVRAGDLSTDERARRVIAYAQKFVVNLHNYLPERTAYEKEGFDFETEESEDANAIFPRDKKIGLPFYLKAVLHRQKTRNTRYDFVFYFDEENLTLRIYRTNFQINRDLLKTTELLLPFVPENKKVAFQMLFEELSRGISVTKLPKVRSEVRSEAPQSAPFPQLLGEILDLKGIRNRKNSEWVSLHRQFFNYFLNDLEGNNSEDEGKIARSIVLKKFFLPPGTRDGLLKDAVRKGTLIPQVRNLYNLSSAYDPKIAKQNPQVDARSTLLQIASQVNRVLVGKEIGSKMPVYEKLTAGLPPSEYFNRFRQWLIENNIKESFLLEPGFIVPGYFDENDDDYKTKDPASAFMLGPVLASRQAGFEPSIRAFPEFARALVEKGVESIEWILPQPDYPKLSPPALLVHFTYPLESPAKDQFRKLAVALLENPLPDFFTEGPGVLDTIQVSEAWVEKARQLDLTFSKSTPVEEKIKKLEALLELALARQVVPRVDYGYFSLEGVERLGAFMGRTPEEQKAIEQDLKFVLEKEMIRGKDPKNRFYREPPSEQSAKEIRKEFEKWVERTRQLEKFGVSSFASEKGVAQRIEIMRGKEGLLRLEEKPIYRPLVQLLLARSNGEWVMDVHDNGLYATKLHKAADVLLAGLPVVENRIKDFQKAEEGQVFLAELLQGILLALPFNPRNAYHENRNVLDFVQAHLIEETKKVLGSDLKISNLPTGLKLEAKKKKEVSPFPSFPQIELKSKEDFETSLIVLRDWVRAFLEKEKKKTRKKDLLDEAERLASAGNFVQAVELMDKSWPQLEDEEKDFLKAPRRNLIEALIKQTVEKVRGIKNQEDQAIPFKNIEFLMRLKPEEAQSYQALLQTLMEESAIQILSGIEQDIAGRQWGEAKSRIDTVEPWAAKFESLKPLLQAEEEKIRQAELQAQQASMLVQTEMPAYRKKALEIQKNAKTLFKEEWDQNRLIRELVNAIAEDKTVPLKALNRVKHHLDSQRTKLGVRGLLFAAGDLIDLLPEDKITTERSEVRMKPEEELPNPDRDEIKIRNLLFAHIRSVDPNSPEIGSFDHLYFRSPPNGIKKFTSKMAESSLPSLSVLFYTGKSNTLFKISRSFNPVLQDWIYQIEETDPEGTSVAGTERAYKIRRDSNGKIMTANVLIRLKSKTQKPEKSSSEQSPDDRLKEIRASHQNFRQWFKKKRLNDQRIQEKKEKLAQLKEESEEEESWENFRKGFGKNFDQESDFGFDPSSRSELRSAPLAQPWITAGEEGPFLSMDESMAQQWLKILRAHLPKDKTHFIIRDEIIFSYPGNLFPPLYFSFEFDSQKEILEFHLYKNRQSRVALPPAIVIPLSASAKRIPFYEDTPISGQRQRQPMGSIPPLLFPSRHDELNFDYIVRAGSGIIHEILGTALLRGLFQQKEGFEAPDFYYLGLDDISKQSTGQRSVFAYPVSGSYSVLNLGDYFNLDSQGRRIDRRLADFVVFDKRSEQPKIKILGEFGAHGKEELFAKWHNTLTAFDMIAKPAERIYFYTTEISSWRDQERYYVPFLKWHITLSVVIKIVHTLNVFYLSVVNLFKNKLTTLETSKPAWVKKERSQDKMVHGEKRKWLAKEILRRFPLLQDIFLMEFKWNRAEHYHREDPNGNYSLRAAAKPTTRIRKGLPDFIDRMNQAVISSRSEARSNPIPEPVEGLNLTANEPIRFFLESLGIHPEKTRLIPIQRGYSLISVESSSTSRLISALNRFVPVYWHIAATTQVWVIAFRAKPLGLLMNEKEGAFQFLDFMPYLEFTSEEEMRQFKRRRENLSFYFEDLLRVLYGEDFHPHNYLYDSPASEHLVSRRPVSVAGLKDIYLPVLLDVYPPSNHYVSALLNASLPRIKDGKNFLVLDGGSGAEAVVIAKTLSVTRHDFHIDAIDIGDLEVKNIEASAASHRVSEYVQAWQSDGFQKVSGQYDFILADPPFPTHEKFETYDIQTQDQDANHFRAILAGLKEHLTSQGALYITLPLKLFPDEQALGLQTLISEGKRFSYERIYTSNDSSLEEQFGIYEIRPYPTTRSELRISTASPKENLVISEHAKILASLLAKYDRKNAKTFRLDEENYEEFQRILHRLEEANLAYLNAKSERYGKADLLRRRLEEILYSNKYLNEEVIAKTTLMPVLVNLLVDLRDIEQREKASPELAPQTKTSPSSHWFYELIKNFIFRLLGGYRVYAVAKSLTDSKRAERVIRQIILQTPLFEFREGAFHFLDWRPVWVRVWEEEADREKNIVEKAKLLHLALNQKVQIENKNYKPIEAKLEEIEKQLEGEQKREELSQARFDALSFKTDLDVLSRAVYPAFTSLHEKAIVLGDESLNEEKRQQDVKSVGDMISEMNAKAIFPALAIHLQSADVAQREKAGKILFKLSFALGDVYSALAHLAGRRDNGEIADVLGQLELAIKALFQTAASALRSEDVSVRKWAALTFYQMTFELQPGAHRLKTLDDSEKNDSTFTSSAQMALMRLKNELKRQVPVLNQVLGDEDSGVRQNATKALGNIRAIASLIRSEVRSQGEEIPYDEDGTGDEDEEGGPHAQLRKQLAFDILSRIKPRGKIRFLELNTEKRRIIISSVDSAGTKQRYDRTLEASYSPILKFLWRYNIQSIYFQGRLVDAWLADKDPEKKNSIYELTLALKQAMSWREKGSGYRIIPLMGPAWRLGLYSNTPEKKIMLKVEKWETPFTVSWENDLSIPGFGKDFFYLALSRNRIMPADTKEPQVIGQPKLIFYVPDEDIVFYPEHAWKKIRQNGPPAFSELQAEKNKLIAKKKKNGGKILFAQLPLRGEGLIAYHIKKKEVLKFEALDFDPSKNRMSLRITGNHEFVDAIQSVTPANIYRFERSELRSISGEPLIWVVKEGMRSEEKGLVYQTAYPPDAIQSRLGSFLLFLYEKLKWRWLGEIYSYWLRNSPAMKQAWNYFHEIVFQFPSLLKEAAAKKIPIVLVVPDDLDGLGPLDKKAPWVEGARVAMTWASAYFRFKELGNVDVRILKAPLKEMGNQTKIFSAVQRLWNVPVPQTATPEDAIQNRVFTLEALLKEKVPQAEKLSFEPYSLLPVSDLQKEIEQEAVIFPPPLKPGEKRVVVTGGAGFLGSHLVESLLKKGYQVVVLDNLATSDIKNLSEVKNHPNFYYQTFDVSKPFNIEGKVYAVMHLASRPSPVDYYQHPEATLVSGLDGTKNTLELAQRKGARYLLASTSEVYGDPEVNPQPETYAGRVNPIGKRSAYDESKRGAETLAMLYQAKFGMDIRIARIFNTYGPRMRLNDGRVVTQFIKSIFDKKPMQLFGGGRQTRSFGYVDDTAAGMLQLLETNKINKGTLMTDRAFNIGNPDEFTVRQLAQMVNLLSGKYELPPVLVAHIPQPDRDDPKKRKPDITRSKKILGYAPATPLEEGLEKTFLYFLNEWKKSQSANNSKMQTHGEMMRHLERSLKKMEEEEAWLEPYLPFAGNDREKALATQKQTYGQILQAFRMLPQRELFLPASLKDETFIDAPVEIGYGQTISQPLTVAQMLALAGPNLKGKILDVGAGSGYTAALLSRFADQVTGIERVPELVQRSSATLKQLGIRNVHIVQGDASRKLPETVSGPYDLIFVSAKATAVPDSLKEQLAPGGALIIPVYSEILRFVKTKDGKVKQETKSPGRYHFVEFVGANDLIQQEAENLHWLWRNMGYQPHPIVLNSSAEFGLEAPFWEHLATVEGEENQMEEISAALRSSKKPPQDVMRSELRRDIRIEAERLGFKIAEQILTGLKLHKPVEQALAIQDVALLLRRLKAGGMSKEKTTQWIQAIATKRVNQMMAHKRWISAEEKESLFTEARLQESQALLQALKGVIKEKTIIEINFPRMFEALPDEERGLQWDRFLRFVQNMIKIKPEIYFRVIVASQPMRDRLKRSKTFASISGHSRVLSEQDPFLKIQRNLEPANLTVTDKVSDFGKGTEKNFYFHAGLYANGDSIVFSGPEAVTLDQLTAASLSLLTQKALDGLRRDKIKTNVFFASNPSVLLGLEVLIHQIANEAQADILTSSAA